MKYALFIDSKQASKAHSSKEVAAVEAYERGLVVDCSADFPKDKAQYGVLCDGCEIREVEE